MAKTPLDTAHSAPPAPLRTWEDMVTPASQPAGIMQSFAHQKIEDYIHQQTIQSLENTITSLRQSNDALRKFAHIAAHDLKAPANAMMQLTDLLSRKYAGAFDDKGEILINGIIESAHKMRVLIDDLLNYSMISPDNTHGQTGCQPALEQALDNLKEMIAEHNALVIYDDLPATTLAPSHFLQIFENLIRNAIQYAAIPRPSIHISATATETEWLFSVRNNGQPIEQEYQQIIFEPFQKLHSNNHSGSGIGLALCRKIIDQAGGKIWVESGNAQDTAFFFTLPR